MKHVRLPLAFLLAGLFLKVAAQPSLARMKTKLEKADQLQATGVRMAVANNSQAGIFFARGKAQLKKEDAQQWLGTQLELRKDVDVLKADASEINTGDFKISKMHQYFKGIKVEHGVLNTTHKDGLVSMMQMEYYPIEDNFNTRPTLTEEQALAKATAYIGAESYAWSDGTSTDPERAKPRGELVIVQTYLAPGQLCLAYKFDILALMPMSRAYVYVNAWNGMVVLNDPIIKHVSGLNGTVAPPSLEEQANGNPGLTLEELNTKRAIEKTDPSPLAAPATGNKSPEVYSNSTGRASTRFVGQQSILTDNQSGQPGFPYRLRSTYNNQNIITLNYLNNPGNAKNNFDANAGDFYDNDNTWTAAENNVTKDDAALDVQFNMQLVSDYWLNVHQRNGWDGNNADIKSFVHVDEYLKATDGNYYKYIMANAYWSKGTMHFGDGGADLTKKQPYTTLDICGHEMGHAITETTCALVYQWESGAINESLSDIWAACITNYAKVHIASLPNELTWRLAEKCANLDKADKGFRDMGNPALFKNPNAYKGTNWVPASLPTCRDFETTDNCGVHTNSGVLNKWFYLITQGEKSANSFGTTYNITGLGFGTSQKIAYLTSLNLPPNASYQTLRIVSTNSTEALYGAGSVELQTIKDAWVAVALDSNIYNMSNTPVFSTNNFTSVAVGAKGDVWAGTNYNGLYHYNGKDWEKRTEITNVRINDIKADKAGNIWIAQSGTQSGASQALAGGVNYLKSPYGASDAYFYTIGSQTNIPSRNARNIFIDTTRTNDGANPKVWVATLNYFNGENTASGMLGQGLYSTTRYFHNVSEGLNIASGTAGIQNVGGNASEIWGFAQANNGINQLLVYDASSYALLNYYDHTTDPVLPSGFVPRSIYGDARKRIWIPLANNGLMVLDEHRRWHNVVLPSTIFPAGAQPSYNAIAGDKYGDIYIGTTAGILFFDRGDGLSTNIDKPGNYKLFSKVNGLPSDVVNAVAYDTSRFKVIVATDNGISFFEPLCVAPYCREYIFTADKSSQSIADGNWSSPATWSDGKIPDSNTVVLLTNNVKVDINAQCLSLTVGLPGSLTVNTGKRLTLYQSDTDIIETSGVPARGGKPRKEHE